MGHVAWHAIVQRRLLRREGVDLGKEAQTATLLGTAALCSGTAWQPVVNAAHGLGLGFNAAAALGGVVCAAAFFGGLRLGRHVWAPILNHVLAPDYANLQADAGLAAAVGGASAAFVGTDCGFGAVGGNWLQPLLGVENTKYKIQNILVTQVKPWTRA